MIRQCTNIHTFEAPNSVPGTNGLLTYLYPPQTNSSSPGCLGKESSHKERIQTPSPTLSSTTMSILMFLPPPFAHSCCLSYLAFRGLKSSETTQCCTHHHHFGLRPTYLFPVSREEPCCQGGPNNGQIRAPELVATPAGLV